MQNVESPGLKNWVCFFSHKRFRISHIILFSKNLAIFYPNWNWVCFRLFLLYCVSCILCSAVNIGFVFHFSCPAFCLAKRNSEGKFPYFLIPWYPDILFLSSQPSSLVNHLLSFSRFKLSTTRSTYPRHPKGTERHYYYNEVPAARWRKIIIFPENSVNYRYFFLLDVNKHNLL